MLVDIGGALFFVIYFAIFLIFIIKKKNIFYPRYRGSPAVMQGLAGIIGGILWVAVFISLRR